jgi:hypothetical protein
MIILTGLLATDMLGGHFAQFELAPNAVRASIWTLLILFGLLGPVVIVAYIRKNMRELPGLFGPAWPLTLVMGLSVGVTSISVLGYALWIGVYGGAAGPLPTVVAVGKLAFAEPVFMGLMLVAAILIISWHSRVRYRLLMYWGLATVFLFVSRFMFELNALLASGTQSVFLLTAGFFGLLALLAKWIAFGEFFRHYAGRVGSLIRVIVLVPVVPTLTILLVPLGVGGSVLALFVPGFLGSGILWGLGFYLVSRRTPRRLVKSFFVSLAFGQIVMMIGTLSVVSPLSLLASPPTFGVVSALYVLPGALLFFWGLYTTGVYLGIDESIRREVQRSAKEMRQLHLVGMIGDAEFLRQIESRVLKVARALEEKAHMKEDLADQDIKYYLDLAVKEKLGAWPKG